MSVYKTAYDTTACSGLKMDEVHLKVKEAIAIGQISKNEYGFYEVMSSGSFASQIPSFLHPVVVETDMDGDVVVVDMRPYCRMTSAMGAHSIFDQAGYNLASVRARLTRKFAGNFSGSLLGFSDVPVRVYTSVIADAASKRLNLGIVDHYTIQILSGIYFYTLFEDKLKNNSPEFINRVSIQLARALGISSSDVKEIAEKASAVELTDIESFCDALKILLNNVRIRDLNFVTLATMLGGIWYGPQGKELVNVALEHPPTLMALIYHAYTDRGFRRTGLGQLLENQYFKKHGQAYIGAINNLTR